MAKEYKDLVVGLDIGTAKVMVVVAEVGMAKVTIQIKVTTRMEVANTQVAEVVVTLLMDQGVVVVVVVVMLVLRMDQVVVMDLDQGMGLQ